MEIKIQVIIDAYKEEVTRLLKAQIKQLQNELSSYNKNDEEV